MIKRASIKEIIQLLDGQVVGVFGNYSDVYIDNLADVNHVNVTTLDWVNPARENKQDLINKSKARVLLVDDTVNDVDGKILIKVRNPKKALAIVGNTLFVKKVKPGIHPTAIIDKEARIDDTVSIGPYCVLGKVVIGEGCVIDSNVRIYDDVIMGKHCRVKAGAVLGGEGFGFERDDEGNRFRFPQIGGLRIGDYVEIGANSCVDRGALSNTIIDDYTKISNLCQIAHNVQVGKNVIITASVEISGSCKVGDNTWLGPNVTVRDGRCIGSNTTVGMGSVVVKDIPADQVWAGNPARKFRSM